MQAFKLVNAGYVDRVIVFDSLPERLLQGVRTRDVAGFPRAWAKWLSSIGSTRKVLKTETVQNADRSYTFRHTPVGDEPCFFVLEYTDLNSDKERWREIVDFLRDTVGPEVRLKEKIHDMAMPLASDPKAPLSVEPEDLMDHALIPVPAEIVAAPAPDVLVKEGERIIVQEPAIKRRGRPKKVTVEA